MSSAPLNRKPRACSALNSNPSFQRRPLTGADPRALMPPPVPTDLVGSPQKHGSHLGDGDGSSRQRSWGLCCTASPLQDRKPRTLLRRREFLLPVLSLKYSLDVKSSRQTDSPVSADSHMRSTAIGVETFCFLLIILTTGGLGHGMQTFIRGAEMQKLCSREKRQTLLR